MRTRATNVIDVCRRPGRADPFGAGLLAVNAQAPGSPVRALACEAVVDACGFELPPGACEP